MNAIINQTPSQHHLMENHLQAACRRVAPLFHINSAVAVNPYHGLVDHSVFDTAVLTEAIFYEAMLPEVSSEAVFSQEHRQKAAAHVAGVLSAQKNVDSLALQLGREPSVLDVSAEEVLAAWSEKNNAASPLALRLPRVQSVADQAVLAEKGNIVALLEQSLFKFLASYLDNTVSSVRSPLAEAGTLYKSYLSYAKLDRSTDVIGLRGLDLLQKVPQQPKQARAWLLEQLGIGDKSCAFLTLYVLRLVARHKGYASYLRSVHFSEDANHLGELPCLVTVALLHELIVRELVEVKLHPTLQTGSRSYFEQLIGRYAELTAREEQNLETLQSRLEQSSNGILKEPSSSVQAPEVQAVFCIDVRSERLRAAWESINPLVDTYGFAGFFAMPIAVTVDADKELLCPPLLSPRFVLTPEQQAKDTLNSPLAIKKGLKTPVATLTQVEGLGLSYGVNLLLDTLRFQKKSKKKPDNVPLAQISLEEQAQLAQNALKHLGLREPLAKVVVLVGHTSEGENNAQIANLRCGACAGHSGLTNARLLAQILNRKEVRALLGQAGHSIDEHVLFVAAEHETVTDQVRLFPESELSGEQELALAKIEDQLAQAAKITTDARVKDLPLGMATQDAAAVFSSMRQDPAEVQTEWGLAGNSFFLVGDRALTRCFDLQGKAFLHSYDQKRDQDLATLKLILTAPAIVGSWINWQYFASTVTKESFGAGTKVVHNLAAGIGVVSGAGGDLQLGLARESVQNGDRQMHAPLRISVIVQADYEAVATIAKEHELLSALVRGEWIKLYAHPGGLTQSQRVVL